MSAFARATLTLALMLVASPAAAHPPPLGLTGFPGGVLHPLFVPAHVMAVAGLGLLIGQQTPGWGRAVLAANVVALATGLSIMTSGFVPTFANETLLGLALITGGLTALARPLPEALGCALAVAIGIALALDSPPEVISLRDANRMLLGTACGAVVLLIGVSMAASRLTRGWQRIGVRIAGSWIAASAILVLALAAAR